MPQSMPLSHNEQSFNLSPQSVKQSLPPGESVEGGTTIQNSHGRSLISQNSKASKTPKNNPLNRKAGHCSNAIDEYQSFNHDTSHYPCTMNSLNHCQPLAHKQDSEPHRLCKHKKQAQRQSQQAFYNNFFNSIDNQHHAHLKNKTRNQKINRYHEYNYLNKEGRHCRQKSVHHGFCVGQDGRQGDNKSLSYIDLLNEPSQQRER